MTPQFIAVLCVLVAFAVVFTAWPTRISAFVTEQREQFPPPTFVRVRWSPGVLRISGIVAWFLVLILLVGLIAKR